MPEGPARGLRQDQQQALSRNKASVAEAVDGSPPFRETIFFLSKARLKSATSDSRNWCVLN